MSKTPRNVRLTLALILFACGICARPTHAQTPKAARETKAAAARARAEKTRRAAVALLLEVAASAKAIEDTSQRAAVLTNCADALWETDERAARSVFGRAWAAAVESDEEEFKDEQENGRYGDLPERFTRARELTLAAAARRDTRMAEAWLGALADWLSRQESSARSEDAPGNNASRDIGPLNEFTRDGQRLALASSLLDEEEYGAAARVATPSLKGGVSGPLVEFLLGLRTGAPEEADRLYLQLLAGVRVNPNADANDLLLLASYALTPRMLAVVNAAGSLQFRALDGERDASAPVPPVSPAGVRSAFYDTAAAMLLPRPEQPAAPGRDSRMTYFAIGRLLPFFELEASRHVPALRARLAELGAGLVDAQRTALDSQMDTLRLSPKNPTDPLGKLLDAAGSAGDTSLRDGARLLVVREAAKKKLWERARRLTEEIEDPEQKRAARLLIDAHVVASVGEAFTDEEEDYERAAALVRAAEVTPALRAYGFAVAAQFAARREKRDRAEVLLGEALNYAAQAEAGTSLRDAAMLTAATCAARIGSPRTWEALATTVVALNEDELYDGDLIWFNLEQRVNFSTGETDALNKALQPFDVEGMFDAAARRSFERAVAEASHLKNPAARARARVAAARAALEQNTRRAGAPAR